MASQARCAAIDDTFGPSLRVCRGGFDFTLLFEESILSILPLSLVLLAIPLRVLFLLRRRVKVKISPLIIVKEVRMVFRRSCIMRIGSN